MLRHFSFYDPASGRLTGEQFATNVDDGIPLNVRDDRPAVEGQHNHRTHRVDLETKAVVPLEPGAITEHPIDRAYRVRQEIQALEQRQARVVREAVLGNKDAQERLQKLDAAIVELRRELTAAK